MKRYAVNITPDVESAIQNALFYTHERSPQNAAAWLWGLYQAIDSLEKLPERCSTVREQEAFEEEVRELLSIIPIVSSSRFRNTAHSF